MNTILHYYYFDTTKTDQASAYDAMVAKLRIEGRSPVVFMGDFTAEAREYREKLKALDGREIELETTHLFDDQWNTAPIKGLSDNGLRVFDWNQDSWENRSIKSGHWLEQTEEMAKVRREYLKCGYCGHMEYLPDRTFCNNCLDSEHLKESELHLLRMVPVEATFGTKRAPLSHDEAALLVPKYREAQIHGSSVRGKARIEKTRAAVEKGYADAIETATTERDGNRWLLDHAPGLIANTIYYNHTKRWSVGWRTPLSPSLLEDVRKSMAGFPFPYDIKETQ